MQAALLCVVHPGAIWDFSTEYLHTYYMDQISSGSTSISFSPLQPSAVQELHSSVPLEFFSVLIDLPLPLPLVLDFRAYGLISRCSQ